MNNELLGLFTFVFLIILIFMIILVPITLIFNWIYLKKLNKILSSLPDEAKKILKEDVGNEAEKSIFYRLVGENFFKEDDFLNRLFTDKSLKVYLKDDDLNMCIKQKKYLRIIIKFLTVLLLVSSISAGVAFILFSA